ncbi:MAG: glycosyltransferase family 9 protein, partial [Deltaproteobacteria bacterium]|nr:glycosyltransferase family 9 protein [Deltaproteobacteria bacterium]
SMGGGFFLTHSVPRNLRNKSQRTVLAEPLSLLGLDVLEYPMELFFSEADLAKAKAVLLKTGIDKKSLVVFSPGALHKTKSWPTNHYARLADLLSSKKGLKICLVGSKQDFPQAQAVEKGCKTKVFDLCDRLSLSETMAIISLSKFFVGNDSGLTHVAAALGIPVVQIFGPGLPQRFGHFGEHDLVFSDPNCPFHPCSPYVCKAPAAWCMKRISPETVYDGIEQKGLFP